MSIELNIDDLRPPAIVKNPEERMKFLVEKSKNFVVEHSIPIRLYISSGRQLLQMANTYLDEMNMEQAFVLYMRYITLFFENLPSHPQYDEINEEDKRSIRSKLKPLFGIAEVIKIRIQNKYKEEYENYLTQKKIYDEKLTKAQKALIEQRQKDQQNLEDKKRQDYVTDLQSQIDKKKRELADKKNENFEDKNEVISDDEDSSSISTDQPIKTQSHHKPVIDRSTKPSMSLLDDVDLDTLRSMIVPFQVLTKKFVKIAQQNTDRNIETCGILCGQLKNDNFTITHILIPKQTGTSDSCTSINEEELLIEQERHNLITMGWIHTHPTQRSFLSSIDLHTHALYQKMLPEAIAIVVAPTTSEIQMYSLTEHGLEFILKCREKGFHPHTNEQSLYHSANHTIINDKLCVDIIDLR
ncbi:AMSH-like protease [Dermatophagoides farinae]|uniref:AMSH-like protease n=1 Tax=Dermatophagoides farinae TaxID=6954 RepID=A0A922HYL6_DERFA|nr:STAM-binding protein-like [Dermatophagoides farinae]KAH7646472.1 hypothetical protein HUG17_2010 [Dermatophagoides farinae]KAH9516936.1 AMSH-like protease [Dermatophagoides farinae]